MRFRLTPAERRARVSEGRWGWANPNRMSRREFIGLRDRMYKEKSKKKEEAERGKREERAAAAHKGAHGIGVRKRGGKLKWLILLIILGATAYYYLRYVKKII